LQTALSEIEIEHFFYARGGCRWCDALMLCYLVAPSYAQVYTAFSYECRDVGGGEEDERKRKVLDKRDIEAGVSVELDV
jgi:hypothetical protein